MLSPAMGCLLIFFIFPMIATVVVSFTDWELGGTNSVHFIGWDNYIGLWESDDFRKKRGEYAFHDDVGCSDLFRAFPSPRTCCSCKRPFGAVLAKHLFPAGNRFARSHGSGLAVDSASRSGHCGCGAALFRHYAEGEFLK